MGSLGRVGTILTIFLILAGCATTASIEQPKTIEGFKHLVFGRISVASDGKPLTWESCGSWKHMICPDELTVLVLPESASTPVRHELRDDGSFFWNLPPGNYTISEFEWVKYAPKRTMTGRIWVNFSVPADKEVVYIGTLALTFFTNRYNFVVQDDYELAFDRLRVQFPTLQTEPFKALLRKEESPQAQHVKDICTENWGIKCTQTNRGVVPVSPECERLAFPAVDSLFPTLRWQPSSKNGITYDLIVYEVITNTKFLETNYFPGRIVIYKEGLEDPNYTVEASLKPNAKYFWSVRLREKDTVSGWSHLNYSSFQFFIVAFGWESANNLLFNFSTPPN